MWILRTKKKLKIDLILIKIDKINFQIQMINNS